MTIRLRTLALLAVAAGAAACHRSTTPPTTTTAAPAESATTMPSATIVEAPFGVLPSGDSVVRYTLTNPHGMQLRVLSYGGIIQSITVPDRNGHLGDVVLGYDSLDGYLHNVPYFGAIVGRYANRIAQGRFRLDGKTYQLDTNNGPNALHGGVQGFDKVLWQVDSFRRSDSVVGVVLTHTSPAGDQGYPGIVVTSVTYTLTADNQIEITYSASSTAATPINLSQHSYFNLAGEGNGNILGDTLTINADRYTPVDSTLIPTGVLAPVAGTPLDFRTPAVIGARIDTPNTQIKFAHGYDHNFVLNHKGDDTVMAARLADPRSGRVLTVYTTQPGLQFYTGNFLDSTIVGKGARKYGFRGGLALETQHFPDSPNHPAFPSTILRPDHAFRQYTVFAFSVDK